MRRIARRDRSARCTSGHLPGLDRLGLRRRDLPALVADPGIRIGEQRRDGGNVERADDGVAHFGIERPAPRDGGEHFLGAGGGDDLHQIGVGKQRRIFEDRGGDQRLHVARQRGDDEFGDRVVVADRVGQDGAHPRQLVLGEALQRLDGEGANMIALVPRTGRASAARSCAPVRRGHRRPGRRRDSGWCRAAADGLAATARRVAGAPFCAR